MLYSIQVRPKFVDPGPLADGLTGHHWSGMDVKIYASLGDLAIYFVDFSFIF